MRSRILILYVRGFRRLKVPALCAQAVLALLWAESASASGCRLSPSECATVNMEMINFEIVERRAYRSLSHLRSGPRQIEALRRRSAYELRRLDVLPRRIGGKYSALWNVSWRMRGQPEPAFRTMVQNADDDLLSRHNSAFRACRAAPRQERADPVSISQDGGIYPQAHALPVQPQDGR